MATFKNVNKILDQFDFFSTPDSHRKTTSNAEKDSRPPSNRPPKQQQLSERPPANRPPQSRSTTYVEDTPSPNKGKKSRSVVGDETMARSVIHATPFQQLAPFATGQQRKTKKLFDEDAHLRKELEDPNDKTVEEDESKDEGEVSALVLKPKEGGAKVSSLFKPKASSNKENEGDGSREECELSFDSLKKRERKRLRNPYVIRFSEVFTNKEIQKMLSQDEPVQKSPEIAASPETRAEPAEEESPVKSPVAHTTTSSTDDIPSPGQLLSSNETNTDQGTTSRSARFKTSLFEDNASCHEYSSLTKITRQMNASEEATESEESSSSVRETENETAVSERPSDDAVEQPSVRTELSEPDERRSSVATTRHAETSRRSKSAGTVKRLSSSEVVVRPKAGGDPRKTLTQMSMNESTLDRILHLDCRRVDVGIGAPVTYELCTFPAGKLAGARKLTKSESLEQLARLKPTATAADHCRRSVSKKQRIHITCLDLSDEQVASMRKCLSSLNGSYVGKGDKSKPDTRLKATLKTTLGKETTHVLVDFDALFRETNLPLKTKCQLLLGALNNCKIVRYEWLVFSTKKGVWLNESKFLLDNYIDEDCEYDEQDFDIRLLKFIREIAAKPPGFAPDTFKSVKNVFVINERKGDDDDDEEGADEAWDSGELDSSFLSMGESLHDYLNELVQKCGGHVTSRLKLAETIVAIDKLGDVDEEAEEDDRARLLIKQEQKYFADRVMEINQVHSSKSQVQVLSSDWILDCVLDMELLDREKYVLVNIYPNASSASSTN